jgi:hypothetical protein
MPVSVFEGLQNSMPVPVVGVQNSMPVSRFEGIIYTINAPSTENGRSLIGAIGIIVT